MLWYINYELLKAFLKAHITPIIFFMDPTLVCETGMFNIMYQSALQPLIELAYSMGHCVAHLLRKRPVGMALYKT